MDSNYFIQYLSDGLVTSLCLIGITTLLYTLLKLKSYKNLPPGPWGIPVFGYLPFLSKEPHRDFYQLSKKYGDIISIQQGPSLLIVLNSLEAIKKAFVKTEAFDGRPSVGVIKRLIGQGLIVATGENWKKQRRFTLSAFRDFGLGTSRMEEFIHSEIQTAVEILHKSKGEPNDVRKITSTIASNVVAYLIFGQRFSADDEHVEKALFHIIESSSEIKIMGFINAFSGLIKYIPDWLSGLKTLIDLKGQIDSFVDNIILEHKNTYDDNDVRDLVDVYLKKKSQQNENEDHIFKPDLLRDNTSSLFMAGTHTTSSMMCWILRMLSAYPNVQKKIQTEIEMVVGTERLPSMKDRPNLIYTEATILEMHRYVSLLPMTLHHEVTEDIILDGYRIPQNSVCLANIWAAHNSLTTWNEPDNFNPERFLDQNGKLIPTLVESVIPFSIGRRNCMGESIAKMEIFLLVTTLCQKFFFTLPEGEVWKFQPDEFSPAITTDNNLICATPRL